MRYNLSRIIFLVFLFALIFFDSFCQADDKARDRATLHGIQSIIVKVHSWEPGWREELKKVGLTENDLESLIERKLETVGIHVIAEEASQKSETEGILNVRIKFANPEPAKKAYKTWDADKDIEKIDTKKKYIYAIRLNLRQLVVLPRDPAFRAWSITWQTESVGLRQMSLIREAVLNAIDVFIEAYSSENPSSPKTN
ncbi:MAG: hypothetical protein PVF56_06995 [Desulfobacterales bacterium]|jgi:hypothetical protein